MYECKCECEYVYVYVSVQRVERARVCVCTSDPVGQRVGGWMVGRFGRRSEDQVGRKAGKGRGEDERRVRLCSRFRGPSFNKYGGQQMLQTVASMRFAARPERLGGP
jgi:hypothetical protein